MSKYTGQAQHVCLLATLFYTLIFHAKVMSVACLRVTLVWTNT